MRHQTIEYIGLPHGYICEVVVHRQFQGGGLGTALLREAITCLIEQGFREIYIERHEENAASAGMMRNAGFMEIATFHDPARRKHGSRCTTVCRILSTDRGNPSVLQD
jgi:ribosomal protein S18 acetylase RimI-like enzyme